jgi:hypothetical protein
VRQAKGKGEGVTESDNTQHMNTTGKNIGKANIDPDKWRRWRIRGIKIAATRALKRIWA